MHYWHILYIDGRPVAEIEIVITPFLTWTDELALELSVTDLDGAEHNIQCPELLSVILARHREELWEMALEKDREEVQSLKQRRPLAAFIMSGDPS